MQTLRVQKYTSLAGVWMSRARNAPFCLGRQVMVLRWKKFPRVLFFFDYIRLGIGTDMLIPRLLDLFILKDAIAAPSSKKAWL